ncbi:MAG: hypothetical protein ABFD96_02350, partial [Armatimonadia bacterium]
KGQERLIIAMNSTTAPRQVTLTLKELRGANRLVEYETSKPYDPTKPLALSLEPGEIRVLHLTPR